MTTYQQLSDDSKVCIYQSNRELTNSETEKIREKLQSFVSVWTAHDLRLKAFGNIYYKHFIVLMVDETDVETSGCSIDKSVHFLKELENEFHISLFDRMNIAYKENELVKVADKISFEPLIGKGKINKNTIVFNNLVSTKKEFETKWEISFDGSWQQRMFTKVA